MEQGPSYQLVKKFPAFYGTLNFITAFISVRHLPLRNQSCKEIKYFKLLRKVYATGWAGFDSQQGERFLFSPNLPGRLWTSPIPLSNGQRCSLPGVKQRDREVDHSFPPSAEVKSE